MTTSTDADDGHGNHLGTVYVLKFDGSGTYHDFVSVESYEALKALVVSETAALRRPPPTTKPSGEAWIPVSECLPNNHQHCLIWLDGAKLPCIGTLNRRHAHSIGSELVYYFAIANGSGDRLLEEVTHWMPLPPKPTKEPK